jgi:hypothetical protein
MYLVFKPRSNIQPWRRWCHPVPHRRSSSLEALHWRCDGAIRELGGCDITKVKIDSFKNRTALIGRSTDLRAVYKLSCSLSPTFNTQGKVPTPPVCSSYGSHRTLTTSSYRKENYGSHSNPRESGYLQPNLRLQFQRWPSRPTTRQEIRRWFVLSPLPPSFSSRSLLTKHKKHQ